MTISSIWSSCFAQGFGALQAPAGARHCGAGAQAAAALPRRRGREEAPGPRQAAAAGEDWGDFVGSAPAAKLEAPRF